MHRIYFNVKSISFCLSLRVQTSPTSFFFVYFVCLFCVFFFFSPSVLLVAFATRMAHTTICSMYLDETKLFLVECKKCLAYRLVRVQIVFDINFKFDYGLTNRCAKRCASGKKFYRIEYISAWKSVASIAIKC